MEKTYDFKKREKIWRTFWQKEKIYQFDEKSKKPFFSTDTPPPYVSAEHLHTGHIMSYAQAEFIVRFKRMQGFNVFYPMGFDDNGLPTERYVEKRYNLDKSKISRREFIKKCLEETKIGAENYRHLWNLLGISVDWSKTYSTINEHCRKIAQWSFLDLVKKNLIYRAEKPIMWCPTCQTAVSQADLEDKEKETNFVYIKAQTEQNEPVVFATTRPELLPSCVGISVHPQDKRYQKLIGQTVIMPITKARIKITTDEMIDPEFGTGIVYFCSSGDRQFLEWENRHPIKNKIYLLNINGKMNEKAGMYQGLTVLETRKKIIEDLKKLNAIAKIEKLRHVVNTHDRCNTDIEYVNSKQWFIRLLETKKEFLKRGNELNWFPKFMKQRYVDWVENLQWDWCISRQRYYGVPFPVWYCEKCQEVILPNERDLPVDPKEEKPKTKTCPKCDSKEFIGEKDVMDTWMTSSLTPIIGARLIKDKKIQKKLYPATLRPQAFEIIRTWLFYTIVKSHYHDNTLPFRDVMISGHGLDEKGRKISKRLGNYTDPQKIISQYGADALRYWATGAKLGKNMRYSSKEIKKGKRTATKIWNASRLAISHLENFIPQKNFELQEPTDIWLVNELEKTIKQTTEHFENYEYSKARDVIDRFFWHSFCDNYLEFIKHRLYGQNDEQAKNTLYITLLSILKLYAPILPFITEEIYQLFFRKIEKDKSIHLSSWPKSNKSFVVSASQIKEFETVLKIIARIRKHKAKQNISMAQEIKEYKIRNKVIVEKYGEMLKKVMRIKQIKC